MTSSLGNLLKSYRVRRGWTQEKLENEAGTGHTTVAQVEQGVRHPNITTIRKLLVALGVDWYAFGRDMQHADPIATYPHAYIAREDQRIAK